MMIMLIFDCRFPKVNKMNKVINCNYLCHCVHLCNSDPHDSALVRL